MTIRDLMRDLSRAGLRLSATEGENVLRVSPASNLTPGLTTAIRENKEALIHMTLEDQRFRETDILQSERRVFELAREHFGLDGNGGEA